MSATGAGGFTVARQLARHLPPLRPDWKFTLLIIGNFSLHDQIQPAELPTNCAIHRAPSEVQRAWPRYKYERRLFPTLIASEGASATLQLNGMMPPGINMPALCHFQDPWPYRPEAWDLGQRDRIIAFLRRRAHTRSLRQAAVAGFTSDYLRQLITSRQGIQPHRSEVFYNGLPDSWIQRARQSMPSLADRPPELISISSVAPYKRQELVMRGLPELIKRPGLRELIYRVVGHPTTQTYIPHLKKLADDLGIGSHVIFEGRVSDERMESFIQRSRAFVLMSVCESFGLPAIEAMSFGLPAVVSNCCAIPEVCADAAVLSPVDDLAALVNNLERVLTDQAFAASLQQRGVQNVQRFQWKDTAAQMAASLEQIVSAR